MSAPSFTSKEYDDFDLSHRDARPMQPIDCLVEEQSAPSYNAWAFLVDSGVTVLIYNYAAPTYLIGTQQQRRHAGPR